MSKGCLSRHLGAGEGLVDLAALERRDGLEEAGAVVGAGLALVAAHLLRRLALWGWCVFTHV